MAAAPPTRIEGRLRRAGLTHHEASSTPHVESPRREAPSGVARPSGQESPEQGHGISARERQDRGTPEAETVTGRVRREATSRADATRMCAAKFNAHRERSRRDKERKTCSEGLDNCGHIEEGLEGRVTAHHSFLLTEHLSTLEYLDEAVARVSTEIDQRCTADQEAIALLDTIPGVGPRAAEILIAEIGTDMSRFPSAKHLASWAGMCPGNHESGGKRLHGKTRKGSRWLRQILVEIAHVASKTKNTYLAAQYRRIAARRGKKRALIAVGHTVLTIVYTMLTRKQPYQDLGAAYFDQRERHRVERRLVQRLERLGYEVALQPRALAS